MAYFNNCNQFFWPILANVCLLKLNYSFFLVISDNTFQHRTQRFHFHFFHHEIDLIVHNFDSFFHFLIMYLAEHSSKKSADWNFSQTFFSSVFFDAKTTGVCFSLSRFFWIFFLDLCGTCQLLFKVFNFFYRSMD